MRSKKNESIRKRKYGNKKKSKKCGCGVKLPFLKWGGDGQTQPQQTDLTSKLKNFYTEASNRVTNEYENLKTSTTNSFDKLKTSTTSVINDTSKQISDNTKDIVNKTQSDAKSTSGKVSNFFSGMFNNAKETFEKFTNKKGSVPTKPIPSVATSSGRSGPSTSTSSLSKSNGRTSSITSSSNSNTDKYNGNAIKRYQNSLNNNNKQGGKRKSSKKQKQYVKTMKSKKTKRRKHLYKHKGGDGCMDGPVGIEKSSLAFTATPITNINAVGPTPNQMYGQTTYPVWRLNNE
jgi:hypothetical protein